MTYLLNQKGSIGDIKSVLKGENITALDIEQAIKNESENKKRKTVL